MKLLPKLPGSTTPQQRQAAAYQKVLRQAAKTGGAMFGPVPAGHTREFFCLDKHTWVWHEEWIDQNGKRRVVTTRYDVRPGSVLKSQGNQTYQGLSDDEARNLLRAVELYHSRVSNHYQQVLQAA